MLAGLEMAGLAGGLHPCERPALQPSLRAV